MLQSNISLIKTNSIKTVSSNSLLERFIYRFFNKNISISRFKKSHYNSILVIIN